MSPAGTDEIVQVGPSQKNTSLVLDQSRTLGLNNCFKGETLTIKCHAEHSST